MGHFPRFAEEYRKKAFTVHGDKYDYTDSNYTGSDSKILIKCNTCGGNFWQRAAAHLQGYGCPSCGRESRKQPKEKTRLFSRFVQKATKKFGNKFTYNLDDYDNSEKKMRITCRLHGEFYRTPASHLYSLHGCPKCGYSAGSNTRRDNLVTFLEKAFSTHGQSYDYSLVDYVNSLTAVRIRCKKHNFVFTQSPATHVYGKGCPKCGREKVISSLKLTKEDFLKNVVRIQGDFYDFSQSAFVDTKTKVKVICPLHGEFYKYPSDLLFKKTGCRKCAGNEPHTTETFIKRALVIHGDKYDYGKSKITKTSKMVTITCSKHGDFEQNYNRHLAGYGCLKCKASKGEIAVRNLLDRFSLKYQAEYSIPGTAYRYDFYLPGYNVYIEFHGQQHYEFVPFFHDTHDKYLQRKIADKTKEELVKVNLGRLIVVSYKHLDNDTLEKYLLRQLIRHGVIPYDTKLS